MIPSSCNKKHFQKIQIFTWVMICIFSATQAQTKKEGIAALLSYPLPDTIKATSFYSEVTIPKEAIISSHLFIVCGFDKGYAGLQTNPAGEKKVIFAAEENQVEWIASGENIILTAGKENVNTHGYWNYNWKDGETYSFYVTVVTDSASNSSTYTGYFFMPEIQKWKFIACFKLQNNTKPLNNLYSSLGNSSEKSREFENKVYFGNQWMRTENGQWKELTASVFSSYDGADESAKYEAGSIRNTFYLQNNQSTNTAIKNVQLLREKSSERPVIDLYKNVDSTIQLKREKEKIFQEIQAGKWDTTGTANGIYYKIIKDGDGAMVNVSDTVIVKYKGQLSNGFVFDETKEEPATFPLKRLIKGWQMGLPFCKQGGKIRLIIPSSLGYGIRNLGIIPPNSILIFDIEVIGLKRNNG